MALRKKYDSLKEIPAEDVRLYVEREGAWHLDVDMKEEKAKLDEFRANNIALTNQLAEQKKRFEGIDPDEVRKLAEEKQRLEEAQQIKAGEVDKVVEGRLKTAKTEWDKQFAAVTSERDSLNARLTAIQIDQGVITVATKRGLRPTAIPDITARARTVFRLVDGAPRAYEADGQTVRVGKDGITPMTLDEWVEQQVADAPHLFESNAGSGAASNGSGGVGNRRVNEALVQGVETARAVLATTPQGQAADAQFVKWLMEHQKEAGVFATVSGLVDQLSDNAAAKMTAEEIASRVSSAASKAPANAG